MINKDLIKRIITDFHLSPLPETKPRELSVPMDSKKIITVIGPRRAGKTYFLFQLMKELIIKEDKKFLVYINFEDERLDFQKEELDLIIQSYRELYPAINLENVYFFFDEIQNIDGWDRFIRRIYDSIGKNIFITGSNSRFLSKEIATSLRGRTLTYEIFPLSFSEYLRFQQVPVDFNSSKYQALIAHHFDNYLKFGGFPGLTGMDNSLKDKELQDYYNTMLFRDLIERYQIKQTNILKYFLKRLMASFTKDFSVNKIFNEFKSQGVKVTKDILYRFLEEVENIFLMFVLKKYDQTLINQELSDKKIYCIDNGLINAVTFKFSEDKGKLLENIIAVEFLRQNKKIFFYRDNVECDFIQVEKDKVVSAVQVCHTIMNVETRNREIKGLVSACKRFKLAMGYIISLEEEEEEIKESGIDIKVISAHKYLLEKQFYERRMNYSAGC